LKVERWTFALDLNGLDDHRSFGRILLRWYNTHGRDLPWRRTREPYAVLVSEFMLQQTQVATVLPYYNEWLRRFPNFSALAEASEGDVLHAWQGLGYYARARNLHATAKLMMHRYCGRFPRDIARMRQLPGVGRYIAHAVATFAFDQSVPIIEANTARVVSRLFDFKLPIDRTAGRNALWGRADSLLPQTSARVYNSALMDLGALICLPRPKCAICPVKRFCRAREPETLPIKKPRLPTKQLTENHIFVMQQEKILLQQADYRWRGMWILPPVEARSTVNQALHTSVFPFTHHQVTLNVFPEPRHKIDSRKHRWFTVDAIDAIPIPSPHRRAIRSLLSHRAAQC
jgi:A/G-specific adenine glycosylase